MSYLTDKFSSQIYDKRIAFVSIALAAMLLFISPKGLNPSVEPDKIASINVTALGQKTDSAKASEVWIAQVSNGGVELPLNSIPSQKGWEDKYSALVSYQQQPTSLAIEIEEPNNLEITFSTHPWSGKVKIEEGKKTTIQDLYSSQPGKYKYTSQVTRAQKRKYSPADKIFISIASFLALIFLCYICLLLGKIKNNLFLLNIILCFAVFFSSDYLMLTLFQKQLLLALSIGSCFIMQTIRANKFIAGYLNRKKILLGIPVILYAGFAFVGIRVFFSEYPLTHLINKIAFFSLFCGWLTFMVLLFLYLTDLCKSKIASTNIQINKQTPRATLIKQYLIFGGIMLACWSVYLIAYFPGNMTPDSLDQWRQATGILDYNDAHPVFHTLIIKILISIWRSPAMISLAQIFALVAVCSSFFVYLSKAGIPLIWLVIASLIVGVIPANGIFSVMLWKDILFCTSVLWVTLILTELATDTYIFNYKTTVVFLAISLFAMALLRHNGTFAVYITIAFLFFWAFKKRQKPVLIAVAIALFSVIAFKKVMIPYVLKIREMPSGYTLYMPVHGMAAVKHFEGDFTPEANKFMLDLLPDSIWKNHFDPYSADYYLFWTGTDFLRNLSDIPTSKVLHEYASTFVRNPFIMSKARLNGSELLWDVTMAQGSFNYIYYTNIDSNKAGLKQHPNPILKPVLNHYLEYTEKHFQPVLWRPGIYNILLAILLLSLFSMRKRYLLIFLPLIGTNFSLIVAMTHQSFRYVYYVPLIFGFIWLLAISKIISPAKIKNNTTNL
ncbi:hypothetical protein [Niastella yeongjuensis]|uniref:hypothetical protein n=1 Tax=Niastella yeongjuensis TaxID=354355 RepID=UPI0015A651A8|nr:hypothetical protein [Niastella yeongjuensis]